MGQAARVCSMILCTSIVNIITREVLGKVISGERHILSHAREYNRKDFMHGQDIMEVVGNANYFLKFSRCSFRIL